MTSAVLLQHFLTGLRPEIGRQLLLRNKPANFADALTDAIQVMNISPTPLTIYQGTKLGEYIPLTELLLIDTPHSSHPPAPTSTLPDVNLSQCELSPTQQQELLALLCDYKDLFATEGGPLGRTLVVRHAIHTEGSPICQPMRHQPMALQSTINAEVQKMLHQGVIQPSFSPWPSPVVMVMAPGGFV